MSLLKDKRQKRKIDKSMCTYMDEAGRTRCKKDKRVITDNDDVEIPKGFTGLCVQCDIDFQIATTRMIQEVERQLDGFAEKYGTARIDIHEIEIMKFFVLALDIEMKTSVDVDPVYLIHTKILWFVEELGEFVKKFKHGAPEEELHEEWIDVLYFWLHIAGIMDINIDRVFSAKFKYNTKRAKGRHQFGIGVGKLDPEDIKKGIANAVERGTLRVDDEDNAQEAAKVLDMADEMKFRVECPGCGGEYEVVASEAQTFKCPNKKCKSHLHKSAEDVEVAEPTMDDLKARLETKTKADPHDPLGIATKYTLKEGSMTMETSVDPGFTCGICVPIKEFEMDKEAYDKHMKLHVRTPTKEDRKKVGEVFKKSAEGDNKNVWG